MREIVERLHEKRQVELAKAILKSNNYRVIKKMDETYAIAVMKNGTRLTSIYVEGIVTNSKGTEVQVSDTPKTFNNRRSAESLRKKAESADSVNLIGGSVEGNYGFQVVEL